MVKLADSSRKPKRSISGSTNAMFNDMITAQRIDLPPTGLQPRGGSFDAYAYGREMTPHQSQVVTNALGAAALFPGTDPSVSRYTYNGYQPPQYYMSPPQVAYASTAGGPGTTDATGGYQAYSDMGNLAYQFQRGVSLENDGGGNGGQGNDTAGPGPSPGTPLQTPPAAQSAYAMPYGYYVNPYGGQYPIMVSTIRWSNSSTSSFSRTDR